MMRKCCILLFVSLLTACSKDTLCITVTSNRTFDTENEMVEVNGSQIVSKMRSKNFRITDARGIEVPYQLTYDGKLIFQVSLGANSSRKYRISRGKPLEPATLATGRFHPERHDDMAWENDVIGYRAYGPESQRLGDKLYGYDIFLKRDATEPILDRLYALNESMEIQARIDSLKREGNREEAARLNDAKSYHIDHGNGMDCYAVGQTLGAATTALLDHGSIVYPWCFDAYQVLDNGPLRFTVALSYPPIRIDADYVVEHRLITLDAGTHLNRTVVKYQGLGADRWLENDSLQNQVSAQHQVITGIVIHDGSEQASYEASNRYIAYTDPTQGADNGEVYIGAVFVDQPVSASVTQHDGVRHVAAINYLTPERSFTYYWGAGWNRSDIPSWNAWLDYLDGYVNKMKSPLVIKIK